MASKRTDLLWVAPDNLTVQDGFNVRYDYGDIDELAQSIIENGVKVPVRGVKDRGTDSYILTDGHRRFRAVQRAIELGHTDILVPLIPDERGISEEKRVLGMVIYNEGKSLTLLEESMVYDRLLSYGMSQAEISRKVGKSPTHISNCIMLANAPTILKNRIKAGEVSASLVIEELKKSDAKTVTDKLVGALQTRSGKISAKNLKPNTKTLKGILDSLEANAAVNTDKVGVVKRLLAYMAGDLTEAKFMEYFNK